MKILYVVPNFEPEAFGGTELHALQLMRQAAAAGHQVIIFARRSNPGQAEYAITASEFEGIPVYTINHTYRDVPGIKQIYRHAALDDHFDHFLRAQQPDLVHVHHLTHLSTGFLPLVKRAGLPLVLTLHDHWLACPRGQRIRVSLDTCDTIDRRQCVPCLQALWPHFKINLPTLLWQDRQVRANLMACDLLIAPSHYHRLKFLEFFPHPEKIKVIRHGLDHEAIQPRRQFRYPARRLGYIGSLIPSKGVHVLLEAFTLLNRPDLELHIHGYAPNFHGDTSYSERLAAAASEHVYFHGAYTPEQLSEILLDLDVLVVPSVWWESYCLTLHEGVLSGLPVVAAEHGALAEATASWAGARSFRPANAQDLADTLSRLLSDEQAFRDALEDRGQVPTLTEMYAETARHYAALQSATEVR